MSDRIAVALNRLSDEAEAMGRPQISKCLFALAVFSAADYLAGNENRAEALMELLGPVAEAIAEQHEGADDGDDEGPDPDFSQRN